MELWILWGQGLLLGFALILAIGPQNAFVLRQGVRRDHIGLVVLICAASDALMITAGTAGIGLLTSRLPDVVGPMRLLGAVYLLGCAALFLVAALHPRNAATAAVSSRRSVVVAAVALTYLNPGMYLDTVLLIGSLANECGSQHRWVFASGAITSSLVWFPGLGYGARALRDVLGRPGARRALDATTAVVMLAFAVSLMRS